MTSEDETTGDAGDESTDERDGSGDGERDDPDDEEASHLDDVADGAGCTEIWERLSEHRED